jgi:hypothetical protein
MICELRLTAKKRIGRLTENQERKNKHYANRPVEQDKSLGQ